MHAMLQQQMHFSFLYLIRFSNVFLQIVKHISVNCKMHWISKMTRQGKRSSQRAMPQQQMHFPFLTPIAVFLGRFQNIYFEMYKLRLKINKICIPFGVQSSVIEYILGVWESRYLHIGSTTNSPGFRRLIAFQIICLVTSQPPNMSEYFNQISRV